MKNVTLFIMGSLLAVPVVFAQQTKTEKAVLLKSTITNVGSETSLVISNDKYKVIQSVGQNWIVGGVEVVVDECSTGIPNQHKALLYKKRWHY